MGMITIKVPKEGFVPNPFHQGIIRNKLCACMSGKKVKKCHGSYPFIEEKELNALLSSMQDREAATMVVPHE